MSRYQGKPMLRLLESYVLKSIGRLSTEQEKLLVSMEPHLSDAFKHTGSWEEIITKTMDFPEKMPTLILESWSKNQKIAREQNIVLDEQKFAEMFVDQNFV